MYDLETIFDKKYLLRANPPKWHKFEIYYEICYGRNITENSGGAFTLNINKVGAKLQIILFSGTILLTFSQN